MSISVFHERFRIYISALWASAFKRGAKSVAMQFEPDKSSSCKVSDAITNLAKLKSGKLICIRTKTRLRRKLVYSPMKSQSFFMIFDVVKQFTSLSSIRLLGKGKLSKFYIEFKDYSMKVFYL